MSFDGTEVVTTDAFVFFWKPPAPFSQWTPSVFEIDGQRYTHAEQYMMAEKARLFDDHEMLERILRSSDPATQKRLGGEVRGFSNDLWHRHRMDIVRAGNMAKFSQSEFLRSALLETGDRVLVEASPRDRIWGIGLRADDSRAHDRSTWRGQNLLGLALMDVRTRLRESETT